MKRLTLVAALLALLAVPACHNTPEAAAVAPAPAPVVVEAPAPAPVVIPAPVAAVTVKAVKPKAKAKPKLDKDVEALAAEYGAFMGQRGQCLRAAVDAKIAGDIKLGKIRDFGNVLKEPGLCGNGAILSFEDAVKKMNAMKAKGFKFH